MANLPLAFSELLAGGIFLVAATTGDSLADVVRGTVSSSPKPLPGAGGGTSSEGPAAAGALGAAGYVNPFPGAKPSRVDQGVDYTGARFLAPGDSEILVADRSSSGWGGGGYIAGKFLSGPLAGKVWFMAEGIRPIVNVGDKIAAGSIVGQPIPSPFNGIRGNIEAGWASPTTPRAPLAKTTGGYSEGQSTAAGQSWNRFMQSLGGAIGQLRGAVVGSVKGLGLP
jgi:hypothetical protein